MATVSGFHNSASAGLDLEYWIESGQVDRGSIDCLDGIVPFGPTGTPIELAVRTKVTNYIDRRTCAELPMGGSARCG